MDEDKVLAKLQELKAREEAKAQEQALKEAKQKREAEERAIEQEALRRYEEEKVNGYIKANDIEALMLYVYGAKITKFNLNEDNKNHWQIIKDIFLANFKYYHIKLKSRDDAMNKRILDTILNHIESKIQAEKKEAEDLRNAKLQEEERPKMIQDFNNFMLSKCRISISMHQYDISSPNRYFVNKSPEFENLFWNHIISRGCFQKCPSCNNKPKVIKRVDYEDTGIKKIVFIEGFYTIYKLSVSQYAQIHTTGAVKYVACCEHLFNLDDNKRYIEADKVKLIDEPVVKLAISGTKVVNNGNVHYNGTKFVEKDYVLYDPEDPYKIKAKREKDIADTTQEIETLRASLQDAIERLNMLRSDSPS